MMRDSAHATDVRATPPAGIAAVLRPVARAALTALRLAAPIVTTVLIQVPPAAAHHVGTYVARDNEISANFKQLKFAIQARKLDVAARLFETGALRKELRARAASLPSGLEEFIRSSLRAGDAGRAEQGLMVFIVALARDLAAGADRQLGQPGMAPEARIAAGQKFLEAIWRYYNLVDFVISQHDPRAAVAMRLAFDDAEGYARSPATPTVAKPGPASAPVAVTADPERLRAALQQIARILTGVIEASSTARRDS